MCQLSNAREELLPSLVGAFRQDDSPVGPAHLLAAELMVYLGLGTQDLVMLFYSKGQAAGHAAGRVQGNAEGHQCAAWDEADLLQAMYDEHEAADNSGDFPPTGQYL